MLRKVRAPRVLRGASCLFRLGGVVVAMLASGALDEVRSNLQDWDETAPWARAIGAPELVAHLTRDVDLKTAREKAVIASRQYAKRQRTWFRNRMKHWQPYSPG